MSARILDGKGLAETVRGEVRERVKRFVEAHGRPPALHVLVVGDDPASVLYTRSKEKACHEVGMVGRLHALPASTAEAELLRRIAELNADPTVDGILVQLPLPQGLHAERILDAIDPKKDVDGLHPTNVGLLALGRPALVPCTPLGCMRLLDMAGVSLEGARAVVLGRSNLVGRPVAQLLTAAHATVTLAHSRSKGVEALCREADVLVVAVGKAELVRGTWVKPGAVVIDVGIHRVPVPGTGAGEGGKMKTVGDVAQEEVRPHAAAITPVPGGVGPLTIAFLLSNTVQAAEARLGNAS
jgi:methylenetetrahydrofolate dehydrogenase (NADP+)/methenyltetrahydrofolate cyclohydrolase